jgi:hypothetical protein
VDGDWRGVEVRALEKETAVIENRGVEEVMDR